MKILLAVDGSPASQAAADEVAARPWPADSQIEVLTVIEPSQAWTLSPIVEELNSASKQLVDSIASRLHAANATVAHGNPKSAIVDHARNVHADLIVVGAHGAGAVERFLLGSVSRAVLRFAPCSVEIV